jgi:outer membrane biogenesis lipoprotein LolB
MGLETIDLTLEEVKEMYDGVQQYCFQDDVASPEDAQSIMQPFYGIEIPLELLKQVIDGN